MSKSVLLLPCAFFFAKGQFKLGVTALFMQLTLIFWPTAFRWARESHERNEVEQMLAEFSLAHHVPSDPYAKTTKKFRQTA